MNFGILGRSLQKNWENNYCRPSPFGFLVPHWKSIRNSWPLFLRKILWSGVEFPATWDDWPRGSETPKFPDAERNCWTFLGNVPGDFENVSIFIWGGAQEINRLQWSESLLSNESDIWHLPKSGDSSERLQAGFICRCSVFLSVIPCHKILGSYAQVSKSRIKNLQTFHTPKQTDPNKPVFFVGFFIASPYQSPPPSFRRLQHPDRPFSSLMRWCTEI